MVGYRSTRTALCLAVILAPTIVFALQRESGAAITLLSPAADTKLSASEPDGGSVTFSWKPLPDVTKYRFRIGSQPELSRPIVDRTVSDPSAQVRGLRPGVYYWRVEAIPVKGAGQGSGAGKFTLEGGASGQAVH